MAMRCTVLLCLLAGALGFTRAPMRMGVGESALRGKKWFVNFSCFGYGDRFCSLSLGADGLCSFADGLEAGLEPGPWRVEVEEGVPYVQIIMPLKEIYRKLYNVPSEAIFWRAPLREDGGRVIASDGKILSEKTSLLGLKSDFVLEGTFSFEPLDDQLEKEPMLSLLAKVNALKENASGKKKVQASAKSGKGKKGAGKGMAN